MKNIKSSTVDFVPEDEDDTNKRKYKKSKSIFKVKTKKKI